MTINPTTSSEGGSNRLIEAAARAEVMALGRRAAVRTHRAQAVSIIGGRNISIINEK